MSVYKIFIAFTLGLLTVSANAAQFDVQRPLLCAIQQIDECTAGEDCVGVTPQSVSLPDFLWIDLANKRVTSAGTQALTSSPIKGVERMNGKLIIQGGDAAGNNPRGGVGWTLSLNEATGKMTIAGVADGFAMIVFGSCIQE